jgi:putative addiction module killer protein
MIDVRRYQRPNGSVPVSDWLRGLGDARAKAKLGIRFARVSLGIFGDVKSVGEGVLELREDIGPGYRVYVASHGATLVILLCGGDKRTQDVGIKRAKDYWQDWKRINV